MTRRITTVYFWICALLLPFALIMFILGFLGLYFFISTGSPPRDGWSGSQPHTIPYLITTVSFILLPIWGTRCWWIHRYTLKGDEDGASARWIETAILNIIMLLFWAFLWTGGHDFATYFPLFIASIAPNLSVSCLSFWMAGKTENIPNKAVDSTATRVTPPAEQEPRHGQP